MNRYMNEYMNRDIKFLKIIKSYYHSESIKTQNIINIFISCEVQKMLSEVQK
jgi:hypothetical protein